MYTRGPNYKGNQVFGLVPGDQAEDKKMLNESPWALFGQPHKVAHKDPKVDQSTSSAGS